MDSLPIAGLKAFSEAIARIYQVADLNLFPGAVFEAIELLFPSVVISIDEFNTKTGIARSAVNIPVSEKDTWPQRLRELVPIEHPVFLARRAGRNEALQISDFLTERQFRLTALYHDVFRPLSVRHQIVLPLAVPDHIAGVTIGRWKKFRPDEVAIAEMLTTHIAIAHVQAQRISALAGLQPSLAPNPQSMTLNGVTPREAEVLRWIVQGKRDGEIATILGASVRTIHKHVQRLFQKLHVETRTAAALRAVELGIAVESRA